MLYHNEQKVIRAETSDFQMVALSVIGDRSEQQDSFGYFFSEDSGIVVICDGMGGHQGGKLASDVAVKTFLSHYNKDYLLFPQTDKVIDVAKEADRMVFGLKTDRNEPLNAGSTVVSITITQKRLMWCAVGDSRAYLIRGEEMVQITQDHNYHTVLVEQMNAGILDQKTFESEDVRGDALISFLGIGNLSLIDYSNSSLKLQSDDRIILMSDGLYKIVTDDEIIRVLDNFSNIEDAIKVLEMKAAKNAKRDAVSRDNMTVALIKIK